MEMRALVGGSLLAFGIVDVGVISTVLAPRLVQTRAAAEPGLLADVSAQGGARAAARELPSVTATATASAIAGKAEAADSVDVGAVELPRDPVVAATVQTDAREQGVDLVPAAAPVFFARGSDHISQPADRALRRAARILRSHPYRRIVVRGHACDLGAASFNVQLSVERAQRVAERLKAYGIVPARLQVEGAGEIAAIAPGSRSRLRRTAQRRVELLWTE